MINSRMICLECVMDILEQGKHSHLVMNETLENYQYLEKRDRAFISRVCIGTIERLIEIDYIINQFSKVKVSKMKPVIRNILRITVYQLKYMDSVPDSAAINEAVKLATKKGFYNLKGFVNGVLRGISRNIDKIEYPAKDSIEYLEVKYSMPAWIIKKWINDYSRETTIKILEGFLNEDGYVSIRCNTNTIKVDDLIDKLSRDIKNIEKSNYCEEGLRIKGFNYLSRLETFKEGLFYVQDESSMICVKEANIKKNDYVIDVCASPGGKALGAAMMLEGTGTVDARDINDYKVNLINDNIDRMNVTNVITKVYDATKLDEESVDKADVVIADLPCSGLGVIGKKVDIKYNVTEKDLLELQDIQRDILDVVKEYVKIDGTLLYSTCTINKGENEDNVNWFLANNRDFKLEKMMQLFPGVDNVDGFFIAKMKRVNR